MIGQKGKSGTLPERLKPLIFGAVCAANLAWPMGSPAEPLSWAGAAAFGGRGRAEPRTISGVVTDSFEVRTDSGLIYALGETPAGNEAGLRVGHRVLATGLVVADGPYRILMVERYRDQGKCPPARL
ncbi:MAG: hypothetical protein AB1568_09750 [Thermodesulfobacteriota bacterium]